MKEDRTTKGLRERLHTEEIKSARNRPRKYKQRVTRQNGDGRKQRDMHRCAVETPPAPATAVKGLSEKPGRANPLLLFACTVTESYTSFSAGRFFRRDPHLHLCEQILLFLDLCLLLRDGLSELFQELLQIRLHRNTKKKEKRYAGSAIFREKS